MSADARTAPPIDPADTVARVATAKREVLLRAYRRRLRREDLEDCYSQATLELLARARRGAAFESPQHISNALEQKFASRINDRHRAAGGRSATETALAGALSLSDEEGQAAEVSDHAPGVAERVLLRHELRRLREVAKELTPDQRLVLFCQVTLGMDSAKFCAEYGWSGEKYRKVAQRARAKLRTLTIDYESGRRCRRLTQDMLAYAAGTADDPQSERVRIHLENCAACATRVRELDRAARHIAALLPAPVAVKTGLMHSGFRAVASAKEHLVLLIRSRPLAGRPHPVPTSVRGAGGAGTAVAGGTGAVSGAGSSLLGAGAAKLGVTALCLAGAAGSFAVCRHEGWVPWNVGGAHHVRSRSRTEARRRGRHAHHPNLSVPSLRSSSAPEGPTSERPPSAPGRGSLVAARERRLGNVQREFGVEGGGRASLARLRHLRSPRRRARAGLARARALRTDAPTGASADRRGRAAGGASGGGAGGDFPGASRASRSSARREFGF